MLLHRAVRACSLDYNSSNNVLLSIIVVHRNLFISILFEIAFMELGLLYCFMSYLFDSTVIL